MAVYCGVCSDRLDDATENYGGFAAAPDFKGWDTRKQYGGTYIHDTCKSCAAVLREAVTKAANQIVKQNAQRVAELAKFIKEQQEADQRSLQEKAEFERDWLIQRAKLRFKGAK